MIFGRPTNLWLGVTTALSGAVSATLILVGKFDPVVVGTLAGVWQGVLGAAVLLVANQPPTLTAGDTYKIATPKGQPSYESTVAPPPLSTTPIVDPAG